jgi:minor extracellular serine protease Vpr
VRPLRRLAFLTLPALLATATSASAAFTPIRRDHGETTLPRLRAGELTIPAAHTRGRVTVIARLRLPPLAAWNAERGLASTRSAQRLDATSAASRRYLAQIVTAQRAAIATLRQAIPQARVQERYRVVLDGLAVSVPATRLPRLARMAFVTKLYPSISYTATMDRGPSVIAADRLEAATGMRGDGIKIGVVDTGVDWRSPFLNSAGYSYPPGFPKGDKKKTTPKVIVARNFPAPASDRKGRQAFDPSEPHGTHVAGIAAGDAGTNVPRGSDHPATANLSGVAPRAWIGSYRVFNVPTPIGHVGNTPQIVAAFERAVLDGMNVINFSGGGAQTDPANDAMYETVKNVAAAGVVPVIASGNDREDFGLGSAGSPGTAPDAIAVAAVSNRHVFAPALSVAGGTPLLQAIPIQTAAGARLPARWASADQTLVDVSSIVGRNGKAVNPYLCGPPGAPNSGPSMLRARALRGAVALALRGRCTFVSKARRARQAGAAGLILIDNRFGEANAIPVSLPIGAGMISDLDGQRLRGFLATVHGRGQFRVTRDIREIETGRSGIVTSFSSAGPTDFGHLLKPDVSAPGLEVLSSTTSPTFSVYAGTSMATPHVSGAAALLLQRHPSWTPANVKSALMSTADAAWSNTARTQEAPVWLEGAGLADVADADAPRIFTDPQSLSFGDLDVSDGAQRRATLLTVADAGDGAGTWTIEVRPQAQTTGVTIDVPGTFSIAPGADVSVPVTVRANADAALGQSSGFLVLSNGVVQRRVPYGFIVERPVLRGVPVKKLAKVQTGDTRRGVNRVSRYCCPSQPFGTPPSYPGPPMNEDGAEQLYAIDVEQPVTNFGVWVRSSSESAVIDPWVLGAKDENEVQGYAGTPVNVNELTSDAHSDVGAAGSQYPRLQRFYVVVDSRADPFTNRSRKGRYVLRWWMDDVRPPVVRMLTQRVSAGRPVLVARAVDSQSGIDPLSLVISYKGMSLGASSYDARTGVILFGIPKDAPKLTTGRQRAVVSASDFQETKNINTPGDDVFPNTTFRNVRIRVVDGPAVSWVMPFNRACVGANRARLVVAGSSTTKPVRVVFRVDGNQIGVDRVARNGVFALGWKTANVKRGQHRLLATLVDSSGRGASAGRTVRICAR